MKKIAFLTIAAMTTLFLSGGLLADVQSLRGDKLDTMAKKPANMKIVNIKGGIERSYKLQPPMVPHEVDKYTIDIKNNGCMKCHSEATYEKEKAPKVGESHYKDRDGKVLKTISSRRYFCSQCHAPQMGADPLVQNNFQGAK
ncbi:MAG: nitrate reductase [gamma proteobacterium symbiont of Ctena orbiculata]|nr:MAG: nitrate reductase [gamma proteobacterium symbiont of Ctena orbiculata]PVV17243.1 MAG: nitrate reductase [gamma proteobacterium symbiont of Ctena orbiculata]PVV18113.1 MAG: nitrate reductase [gamma proteobacterium symbiont of Ctena orbiculata]